jgi:tripartite-type tricarboxylate transporter receptor subunit TctC
MGLYAPARTEPRIAARLQAEIATVLREPAMTARMEQLGMIMAEDTANYIAFTKRDDARYAASVQKLHLHQELTRHI